VNTELMRAWGARDKDELDALLSDIAHRAGAGNEPATEMLLRFVSRSGALRPIIARYVPDSEVDDVEQKTLIAVQRSIGSFQGRSRCMTWLHSVGVNTALAHQRTLSRRRELPQDSMANEDDDDDGRFSSVVAGRMDLDAAALSLPTEQRQVMALWNEGFSYEEIATRVGVPVGTVRSRISRARDRLRDLTSVDDSEPSPNDD
jgi:RNA polymerase sigma-70 factor (ECF subfamily)